MSKHGLAAILVIAIAVVILAACASPAVPTPANPSAAVTPAPRATTATTLPTTVNPSMGGPSMGTPVPRPTPLGVVQVTQAKEDLGKRLSVAVDKVELVSGQAVTWPDASLGCPKPGLSYAQALTDGYRIQLSASGKLYQYHSSRTGAPFLCDNPQPPVSVGE